MAIMLMACTGAGSPPSDGTSPVETDTGSTSSYFEVQPLDPELDASEMEGAITAAIDGSIIMPLDLFRWSMGVVDDVAQTKDPDCPQWEDSPTIENTQISNWFGECSGSAYAVDGGWLLSLTLNEDVEAASYSLSTSELYSFQGEAVADGGKLQAGGKGHHRWDHFPGVSIFDLRWSGTFLDESADGPLKDGISGSVIFHGRIDSDGVFTAELDGVSSGGGGALSFGLLEFQEGCKGPVGTLKVRDPSSGWWTLEMSEDCSGCGPLSWYGEAHGDLCVGESLTSFLTDRIAFYEENPPR